MGQNKWKTIGFAPQKMNVKIFERFRRACDDFFKKKGEFFKSLKEGMNENLEKKKALFLFLCRMGFREIEVGFPAATDNTYQFESTQSEHKLRRIK